MSAAPFPRPGHLFFMFYDLTSQSLSSDTKWTGGHMPITGSRYNNQQSLQHKNYVTNFHDKENISITFLAKVNSRSRSLYAVARPSVICLSVCNARAPYSGG